MVPVAGTGQGREGKGGDAVQGRTKALNEQLQLTSHGGNLDQISGEIDGMLADVQGSIRIRIWRAKDRVGGGWSEGEGLA